jgi:hypothetical protein
MFCAVAPNILCSGTQYFVQWHLIFCAVAPNIFSTLNAFLSLHTDASRTKHTQSTQRHITSDVHMSLKNCRSSVWNWLYVTFLLSCSRYSDWPRAGRSGNRILVEARFSATVQTGPVAHPASCTMYTGSFPRVNSGRGVTLTPHPLLVPLVMKE